eukprot:TRINITY_DN6052_c0_g1_i3.p1 TRINITY_DN6052_c0_g1~~TRINITY_DN6052_c0_g1_i3.p1  ORF type:complete len:106 (+),score=37.82 TRINITY_DN6052_c0_g1_i3:63-380(+)
MCIRDSFYIRQQFGTDLPVNAKDDVYRESGDQHHKIERFLVSKKKGKKDILPRLTNFYDEELQEVGNGDEKYEEVTEKDRQMKRKMLEDRLGGDQKLTNLKMEAK